MALNWLLNLHVENNGVRLLFKGEEGRFSVFDRYEPYFYMVCRNPDESRYLMENHPRVSGAEVEERFPDIRAHEKRPLVKVRCGLRDFRAVIGDARRVEGVEEIAETAVPHYFRYMMDRRLGFFRAYRISGGKFLQIETEGMPALDLATYRSGPLPGADVVFTYGGDTFLRGRRGVIESSLGCFLPDAIHIDIRKDMDHDIYNEAGMRGLMETGKDRLVRIIELSGISGAKPDLVPRISAGKLNCYLHIVAARESGHIVPDLRKPVERPKTLKFLRYMDRGGTIIYPKVGVFRNVAKCDFASLYPGIIINYNISPETMHCACGDDFEVPDTDWRICRKKGVIPRGLEKVLHRRLELKAKMKASSGEARRTYDIQQRALKNILVTCFGYLGYSNFVFSNVETKECVVHYGRLIMERTKEMADSMGLEVLYGYVDSVFVAGGTPDDYRSFTERAGREFGIGLALDCTFGAIAFPSSGGCAVANHYYGITTDGEIEARGIAYRHSDAPEFIRKFQEEGIRAFLGERERLDGIYLGYQKKLLERRFSLEELKIVKSIRKEEYRANQPHVVAYKQAREKLGFVEFVYTVYGPKPLELANASETDIPKYLALLKRARDELVSF